MPKTQPGRKSPNHRKHARPQARKNLGTPIYLAAARLTAPAFGRQAPNSQPASSTPDQKAVEVGNTVSTRARTEWTPKSCIKNWQAAADKADKE
jgi:hypothetical protein